MSIEDVARHAGVSIATVSRVFNVPDRVVPTTREKVRAAAALVGYVPNANARTLRMRHSRVIGVVLPTLLNPVFAECLDGIAPAAEAQGYAILPLTTDYRLDGEEAAVRRLLAANVDGMILVVSNPEDCAVLRALQAKGVPYVLIYNRHPAHPCVSVDGVKAVDELIGRLIARGHRRIVMVAGHLAASDRAQQRHRGYLQAMHRFGLEPAALLEVPFVDTAVARIAAFLRQPGRPSALFCSNDLLAIRSIRAAHVAGLAVPRDLAVAGFDGIELGRDLTPMLTTVAQPNRELGRQGVSTLLGALAAGRAPQAEDSITLPHSYRAGESCAEAPQGFA